MFRVNRFQKIRARASDDVTVMTSGLTISLKLARELDLKTILIQVCDSVEKILSGARGKIVEWLNVTLPPDPQRFSWCWCSSLVGHDVKCEGAASLSTKCFKNNSPTTFKVN